MRNFAAAFALQIDKQPDKHGSVFEDFHYGETMLAECVTQARSAPSTLGNVNWRLFLPALEGYECICDQ